MPERSFADIAQGLVRAIQTPTDELAARRGEGDLMVQVKRNSDRLATCGGHQFERQPDWRSAPMLSRQKVRCLKCDGEMAMHDVSIYLRGVAHGSGQSHEHLMNAVFPAGAQV